MNMSYSSTLISIYFGISFGMIVSTLKKRKMKNEYKTKKAMLQEEAAQIGLFFAVADECESSDVKVILRLERFSKNKVSLWTVVHKETKFTFAIRPGLFILVKPLLQFNRDIVENHRVDAFGGTHIVERDVNGRERNLLQLAAAKAGHADGVESVRIRPFYRADYVRAVSGAGNCDDNVAGAGVSPKLLLENGGIAFVIAVSGHKGNVVCE
jgi:hypothetical protein